MTKPGFRLFAGAGLGSLWVLIRIGWRFLRRVEGSPEWVRLGEQFKNLQLHASAEWVLDGRRQSPLAEFVTWSGERGKKDR